MSLTILCNKLQYQFNNLALLEAALSHRSIAGNNNERLEFLGDSILNFVVAELLYHYFPEATEGELSRWRAHLVKEESLAQLAKTFDLGQYLRLGSGELKSGGYRRHSILADAMEAIIAAIYLDAGMETCKNCLTRWFSPKMTELNDQELIKDPKSLLQEYLQGRHLSLPHYEIFQVEGEAHAQLFHVRCHIKELALSAESTGSSRRKAEQSAAEKILSLLTSSTGFSL